jgi:hypothetical protein
MSNENIYSAVVTDNKTLKIYDEICGAMFVNLYTRSKDWETIDLASFDPKNEEHLFVLGVARGLGGAFSKKVRIDVSRWQLWKLNRGIDKDCRIERFNNQEGVAIDVPSILDFMREQAVKATNNIAVFRSIDHEFYERKK